MERSEDSHGVAIEHHSRADEPTEPHCRVEDHHGKAGGAVDHHGGAEDHHGGAGVTKTESMDRLMMALEVITGLAGSSRVTSMVMSRQTGSSGMTSVMGQEVQNQSLWP